MENSSYFETLYIPNSTGLLNNVKIEQKDQNEVIKFLAKHGINIDNFAMCLDIRPFKCSFCEMRFGFNTDLEYELMGHFRENHLDRIVKVEPQIDFGNNISEFGNDALQQEELSPETEDLQNEEEENVENSKKKYKCTTCNASYKFSKSLKKHIMEQHTIKQYKCEICLKEFKRNGALIEHQAVHKPPEFECIECNKQFIRFRLFSKHKLEVHDLKVGSKREYIKNKEAQQNRNSTIDFKVEMPVSDDETEQEESQKDTETEFLKEEHSLRPKGKCLKLMTLNCPQTFSPFWVNIPVF